MKETKDKAQREESESDNDGGSDDDNDNDSGSDDSNDDDSDDDSDDESAPKSFRNEQELNTFRNAMQIKVKGSDVVNPISSFDNMPIHNRIKPIILSNIEKSTWKEPTAIQMQAIPVMLSGRDVLAAAPTGSGKTAAFVIPVLSKIGGLKEGTNAAKKNNGKFELKKGVRALLLAPTRELAEQIYRETERLCAGKKLKVCFLKKRTVNAAHMHQERSAFNSFDILVSTPMRLLMLIRNKAIDLSNVSSIVLDEADKLFELDGHSKSAWTKEAESGDENGEEEEKGAVQTRSAFLTQVDEILAECPSSGVQRALFSATIGPFVSELAEQFLQNHVQINIGIENAGAASIEQKLLFVGREDGKLLAMRQLVQEGLKPPVLLFVQSVDRAKELFRELAYDGINVDTIHAEKTQHQREDVIRRFRSGDVWVLICTELMSRGVDFKGVQMVINYDLPQSAVSYIHRIGRTGRAGRKGLAVTLFTEADIPKLRSIANVVKLSGCEVPEWMLAIPKLSTREKRKIRNAPPQRRKIDTSNSFKMQAKDVKRGAKKNKKQGGAQNPSKRQKK